MSKTWDRLGQIAVLGGTLDVLLYGILSILYRHGALTAPGGASQRLISALSDVTHITKAVASGVPLLAVPLVLIGVGMLRERPWSGRAAMVWSCAALVLLCLQVFVEVRLVWPRIEALQLAEVQRGASERTLHAYGAVKYSTLRIALGRMIFPLLLLWQVGRRPIATNR